MPSKFTLSIPLSNESSPSSSSASSPVGQGVHPYNLDGKPLVDLSPGIQPKDVYDTGLSWWRAAIRRRLVARVRWESRVIARMQEKIRTPWLDAYFVYTSSLGTHTFFMTVLPAMFFFGLPEMGRGLLMVLALGVYCSSVVKDLICSPRPFAPPVTRLTIGTHHLEYGFPSTHSTNCVSIALFFFSHLHRLASTPASSISGATITSIANNSTAPLSTTITDIQPLPLISPLVYTFLSVLLGIYTFSIVFGRLYTAMHSFTDCTMGVVLGTLIWWVQSSWEGFPVLFTENDWGYNTLVRLGIGRVHMSLPIPFPDVTSIPVTVLSSPPLLINLFKGLSLSTHIESWLTSQTFQVPLVLIPLTLWAVHQHPQPVDDCPCFEDAIAFMSVLMGAFVARWGTCYNGGEGGVSDGISIAGIAKTVVMPGSGWVLLDDVWVEVDREWGDVVVWWLVATVKMVVGILTIFIWRILAKSILHMLLPPLFRLLSQAIRLPHRRFYTPAIEYKSIPSQFNLFHSSSMGGREDRGGAAMFGLHPIPSVIDLPTNAGVGFEVGRSGNGIDGVSNDLKMRVRGGGGAGNGVNGEVDEKIQNGNGYDKESVGKDGEISNVKHYDADVLTKVIVYAGIAVLATEILPLWFELVGLGVKSWA